MDVSKFKQVNEIMKEGYWQRWNDDVQQEINRDIDKNRKSDAVIALGKDAGGVEVKVEQVSHSFIFGAHIFNFDQLGTDERNQRYKQLYGTLFNSATIPFYWKKFELEEDKPRFAAEFRDSAEYWNAVTDPKAEAHWRRPATDPLVDFCESKGIRLHGHTLTWGNSRWHMPEWLIAKLPHPYGERIPELFPESPNSTVEMFKDFSAAHLEAMFPEFTRLINDKMASRIAQIALRYKDRIHSWDVVNESATDYGSGAQIPGSGICKSWYGIMPGDYSYRSFKLAEAYLPADAKLNINDYIQDERFANQTCDLLSRGCKIDIVGEQMHLFNPQICQDIADGTSDVQSPEHVRKIMNCLNKTGLPLHLSEITITAPNNDERGQAIQAIITRNLYRLWFSVEKMMGITWWNVVDDCGAPGEPSVSGLFSRDMQPKTAYYVLNDLINNEWKTRTAVKADKEGNISFTGFKGSYDITWINKDGKEQLQKIQVN